MEIVNVTSEGKEGVKVGVEGDPCTRSYQK